MCAQLGKSLGLADIPIVVELSTRDRSKRRARNESKNLPSVSTFVSG